MNETIQSLLQKLDTSADLEAARTIRKIKALDFHSSPTPDYLR